MTALSGYEFAQRILDRFPANAIDRILEDIHGETEWLEFKAGMCLLPEDEKNGDKPIDHYWSIAREAIAMANASGGLIIIGVKDKVLTPVPLTDNDPRHVIDRKGLEAYLREEVINRIFPKSRKWAGLKDGSSYEIPVSIGEFFEVRAAKRKDVDVAAILVAPMPAGEFIKVTCTLNGKRAEKMPIRRKGAIGEAPILETSDEFESYAKQRRTRISTLGEWWARLVPSDSYQPHAVGSEYEAKDISTGDGDTDRLVSRLDGHERRTEFRPGEMIGDYTVIRKLGAGGMGVVYEVEHPNLKVHRALKVFSTNIPQADILERRFLTEGRLLARLNHPGIVRVHNLDASKKSGCLYYEMDLVLPSNDPKEKPKTLADFIKKVNDRRAAKIFGKLCDALSYLHKQDIVHRDIKLENVLMDTNKHPILSDFGIVRIHDPELKKAVNCNVTFTHLETWTTHYLAPELEKPGTHADAKSDAFALGVMFFRLLTGNWPEGNIEASLKKHSRFWRKTLKRLLAQNPNQRPNDLSKFAPKIRYRYPSTRRRFLVALAVFGAIILLLLPFLFCSDTGKAIISSVMRAVEVETVSVNNSSRRHVVAVSELHRHVSSASRGDTGLRPFSSDEIDQAEQDLRHLRIKNFSRTDTNFPNELNEEIDGLVARLRAVDATKNEYRKLGMRIDEITASHRNLVNECAAIRRTAVNRLNELIVESEYEYALKYYKAVSQLFTCAGFRDIDRPDFRPAKSR